MIKILIVGLGGFGGAIGRYLITEWANRLLPGKFPYGTLIVNLAGSFVLGYLAALVLRSEMAPNTRLLVMTGFLGAFTTFSTFSVENLQLFQNGLTGQAVLNILMSVVGGLLLAYAGYEMGKH